MFKNYILFFFSSFIFFHSCESSNEPVIKAETLLAEKTENKKAFVKTMQKHLDAVTNKDLATLKSTMSPEGKMQLILNGQEILKGVDAFMEFHEEWFADTTWTFETKILNTEVDERIGIAVTEIVYREPERNGKPYFNRMTVSYALENINDSWYIIQDHATSVEKTGD